ncbi:hypothetical protein N7481_003666 [Penicillium waksmanii]|uniref:uncharacterized protein n=1 Tax=Penicillium waksmanii TaxID=69791 RepID=UPI002546F1C6|nr:uncharacterized protein N7481_003666 [Penicillium waksmanii]KAJ5988456.1 hypothetical protein N7481_003666 [Penicillium waksmanii]
MSSNTSSRQNSIQSPTGIVKDFDVHSIAIDKKETATTSPSGFKRRWQDIRKKWGPLMAAKEHLDDEYTFPPGRYAGQGI